MDIDKSCRELTIPGAGSEPICERDRFFMSIFQRRTSPDQDPNFAHEPFEVAGEGPTHLMR